MHYIPRMNFHILTFGCQMNVGDSQWLSRALRSRGWQETTDEQADVIIINTCSVRDKPEQKVYSLLGRLASIVRETGAFVAVGGCVAQQIGAGFWNRFPFVRLVFGTDGVAGVPQALERLSSTPRLRLSLLDFSEEYVERGQDFPDACVSPSAFVTIMQGCNNFCAYCIVPYVRGRQKSRTSASIISECESLIARGAREITLLGQNVNSYGQDAGGDGLSFTQLLRRVAVLPGLARLRFVTSHPKDIAPEVVAAFGELEQLCPCLHLPMQSGSDAVLARMGRKYDRARYLDIVRRLRQARPGMVLTTDIIVGFPGETEQDFRATMDVLEEVRFERSFSFKYSDRPGVAAERMAFKVPEEVKTERLAIFQARQAELTAEDLRAQEGRRVSVLLEELSKRQDEGGLSWRGREPGGRVVDIPVTEGGPDLTGALATVRISLARKHSLLGEMEGTP